MADEIEVAAAREELLTSLLVERFGTPPRRRAVRRPLTPVETRRPTPAAGRKER